VLCQHRRQPQLGLAQEARGDHRVAQAGQGEAEIAIEQADVVVRAVKDLLDRAVAKGPLERGEINPREGIDESVTMGGGQLHQADLLR
jgi:hypothetical protein